MQAFTFEAVQGLIGRIALLGILHSLWIGLGVAAKVALAFQYRRHLSHRSRYKHLLLAFFFAATAPLVVAPMHKS